VRLGTESGEFSPAVTAEQAAFLAIALVDGAGIPLALGDPDLTVASATAGVLATLTALLGATDGEASRPR
jgi:hypothetical protein